MPPIRMPRRNPNKKPSLTEMPNHPASEKPGSAEHDDTALVHGRHGSNSLAYVGADSIIQITWTASRANCTRLLWIGVSKACTTASKCCLEGGNVGSLRDPIAQEASHAG